MRLVTRNGAKRRTVCEAVINAGNYFVIVSLVPWRGKALVSCGAPREHLGDFFIVYK